MNTISAYWTNGKSNFGDSVTPELVSFMLQQPVSWADKWHSEVLTIGSILGWTLFKPPRRGISGKIDAARMLIRRTLTSPVRVFGSGFLFNPIKGSLSPHLRRKPLFFAVRGCKTLEILHALKLVDRGAQTIALGDPGLFFSDLWPDVKRTDRNSRAYIPHESEWGSEKLSAFSSSYPDITLIDVRRPPKDVFSEIASCSEVFSSSLHGLVSADALGIPNRWVRLEIPGRSVEEDRFKFDDYYSAFGLVSNPCELADVPIIQTGPQVPKNAVKERRAALYEALNHLRISYGK